MNCLDSSFLIDYLDGLDDAQAYLEGQPAGSFYTPSHVLFELYDGLGEYTDRDLDAFDQAIDWVTPIPFTAASAREAITIKYELQAAGNAINLKDVLIAGTVRNIGGTIVTADGHFEDVEGLRVENHRER